MKLSKKFWGCICLITAIVGFTGSAFASAQEVGPGIEKAAKEPDQMVVVVGDGSGSSRVTVTYYEKTGNENWTEVFSVPGYCGNQGITADKKEGDRKTPSGEYNFTMSFGIYEDPGSVLTYHQVNSSDYWVDDASSRYYNQLVNTAATPVSWNSAEHLIKIVPQYHYGLVINYNEECVPGKGSAIFLHGYHTTKTWTEGCIAIPEEQVKLLIQTLTADSRILIAASQEELEAE